MPPDRLLFVRTVLDELRTRSEETREKPQDETSWSPLHPNQVEKSLEVFAERSVHYVQLEEAFGRPPNLAEFGRSAFEYRSVALAPEVNLAWEIYQQAVGAAMATATVPPERKPEPVDEHARDLLFLSPESPIPFQ